MSAKKKTISRVLALVLIVGLIVPTLLAVSVSASAPVGFSLTTDVSVANAFWKEIDIYGILNSVDSGQLLVAKCTSSSFPWMFFYFERDYCYVNTATSISSSASEYPFLVPESYSGTVTGYNFLLNYDKALSLHVKNATEYYFLTADSYVYFDSQGLYIGNMGKISTDGSVSYNETYSKSKSMTQFLYSTNDPSEYDPEPEIIYPSSAEIPTFTTNLTSATHYYLQGVTADPLIVEAEVSDGGSIEYEWRIVGDTSGMVYGQGASFVPPTGTPGEYQYVCIARNKVYNPNVQGEYIYSTDAYSFSDTVIVVASSTDPNESTTPTTPDYSEKFDDLQNSMDEMPDKITDGMQDIMEQEKEQATQQGGQFVDDLTGVVPNDSQGFIDALGSLVSVLSYDGTECVLPIPALTLPAIAGLFPSYTVMEAQEVDFEEFFAMMPPAIMLLVQSLSTAALIVYCFKELYDTVAYFFVLKGGNK